MAKRILRYLAGTIYQGIEFGGELDLTIHSDSDWAGDVESRNCTSGMVVRMGTLILKWNLKQQKIVALYTAESEYGWRYTTIFSSIARLQGGSWNGVVRVFTLATKWNDEERYLLNLEFKEASYMMKDCAICDY